MNKIGTTNNGDVIVEMTLAEWEWLENARKPKVDPYLPLRKLNQENIDRLRGDRASTSVKALEVRIPAIIKEAMEEAMVLAEKRIRASMVRGRGQSADGGLPVGDVS